MKQATILQLNDLNQHFYKVTAEEFSKTRSFYWKGWGELIEPLKEIGKNHPQLKVLDIGCGNGRFGEFLWKKSIHKKLVYHGGDNSQELLDFAQQRLGEHSFEKNLFYLDLINALIKDNLSEVLPQKKYQVITLFGVLHHIPSQKLRKKLFSAIEDHLTNGGIFVFTAWRFLNEKRFEKKQLHPGLVKIDPDELEENDFILDWQRGLTAYRYCHYTSDKEVKELTKNTSFTLEKEYTADGKSGNLNSYQILRKP
ncbi:MAG: class I SAM-dependent methyltransferase [Candidatus Pacebacteria bacterium]|jgi:tRNA (uracil-5-)-methyltransferase TRM9|nr:class I SAM-dependent methyltransferase [Candidatus Paceibacterota bacterium]MBT4652635.1 class I SAM-dependent methyltransferase [Candidatus Paceibacterota bacterium]MBT6756519.1 class I SAM-dependent methyltransferase [Candidatus Paceibacterota bacterium]MBT6921335.1 class I SAM-dependent methyltransferase [Candidatus Paceibacterota bacterium]